MEDSLSNHQNQRPVSTRSALRKAGVGEIVEVQGGHIVRATGRKDRHSKVCTAKGPRDRRVRLAAHTAIQFYDVQDRLGYDRPSKAVDWLINKAKSAIDELDQLPAWSPTNMDVSSSSKGRRKCSTGDGVAELTDAAAEAAARVVEEEPPQQIYNSCSTSSLLPPSLHSDAIADTIKSFFPVGGGGGGGGSAHPTTTSSASPPPQMQFQDYPHGGLLQRGGSSSSTRQSQDLRLSLQSFQDPIMMQPHHHHQVSHDEQQQSLFPGATPVGFGDPTAGWVESEHQPSPEIGRLHRLVVGWNNNHHHNSTEHHNVSGGGSGGGGGGSGGGGGGFMFNSLPLFQPLFGGHNSHFITQRGPLQSSNTPSIRNWISDPSIATSNEHHHQAISIHPQGMSGIGFASGGFSGFHIPARIQGEEEHDGDLNKPSSATSGSRH